MDRVNTEGFVENLYNLSELGEDRVAVDCIVVVIDDLLNHGLFIHCDNLLTKIQVHKLSDPLLVSFLGMTKTAKEHLPHRGEFYAKVLFVVKQRRCEEDANKLLKKYL